MVKRWWLANGEHGLRMAENECGGWVFYDDHLATVAAHEAVARELAGMLKEESGFSGRIEQLICLAELNVENKSEASRRRNEVKE